MIIPVQLCPLYIARFLASNDSLFRIDGTRENSVSNMTVA